MLDKCGTPNLSRTLNSILMQHIRVCLPGMYMYVCIMYDLMNVFMYVCIYECIDIKYRINTMMLDIQANLDALGESMVVS